MQIVSIRSQGTMMMQRMTLNTIVATIKVLMRVHSMANQRQVQAPLPLHKRVASLAVLDHTRVGVRQVGLQGKGVKVR